MKRILLVAGSLAVVLLVCLGAASISYTTYLYNINVATNTVTKTLTLNGADLAGQLTNKFDKAATQTANTFLAGPTSGGAAAPTMRALVAADYAALPVTIGVACSDETTAITATTAKVTFRMPHAMTVTAVRASLTTAQASGNIFTVDINEGASSILSTKLTIDNTETTSTTADTAPVISDSALADDAVITVDVDQIGNGTATGLKIWLIGTR